MRISVFLVLLAGACGGSSGSTVTPPQVQHGSVSGRVVDDTDAGVADVGISLVRTGFATRTAASGATGNFNVANVETGVWTVTAVAGSGYVADGSLSSSVQVTANQTANVPAFRLRRATAPPPAPGTAVVNIRDNSFDPASVTVAVNATVRWVNGGAAAHTSTRTGTWSSGVLSPGSSFDRVFTAAGTFEYECTLHVGMTGTVIVQ